MGRVEAFSDGVIAVIITIMVLELHPPEAVTFAAFRTDLPTLLLYALSFIVVASMWVHHHSLLRYARSSDARFIWSNMNLLFWMSLVPFATSTLGHFPKDPLPVAAYAAVFLVTSFSFWILQTILTRHNRDNPAATKALNKMRLQALSSTCAYVIAIAAAWIYLPLAYIIFFVIAFTYVVPPLFAQQQTTSDLPTTEA